MDDSAHTLFLIPQSRSQSFCHTALTNLAFCQRGWLQASLAYTHNETAWQRKILCHKPTAQSQQVFEDLDYDWLNMLVIYIHLLVVMIA